MLSNVLLQRAFVIDANESSVQLVRHTRTVRLKVGKEQQYMLVARHTLKVHVWTRVSKCKQPKLHAGLMTPNTPQFI